MVDFDETGKSELADRMAGLLQQKRVEKLRQFSEGELLIQFSGGTRLYINSTQGKLEFSVVETEEHSGSEDI